jgi:hypothetical protein
LGGIVAWIDRRGDNRRGLSDQIAGLQETGDRQAAATTELAAQVGGLRVTLEDHGNRLTEHHWRLKALEDTSLKVTVERAAP